MPIVLDGKNMIATISIQLSDAEPEFDLESTCVRFEAIQDNKPITCAISKEALSFTYHGKGVRPLDCFRANRASIESKVKRLIEQGRFEQDGSILIRSED